MKGINITSAFKVDFKFICKRSLLITVHYYLQRKHKLLYGCIVVLLSHIYNMVIYAFLLFILGGK